MYIQFSFNVINPFHNLILLHDYMYNNICINQLKLILESDNAAFGSLKKDKVKYTLSLLLTFSKEPNESNHKSPTVIVRIKRN